MKCDGYSDEEIARNVELIIATNGWMVQGVEGDEGPETDFAYTIGLTASFGLPELVIMDLPAVDAHSIISVAIEELRSGQTLDGLAHHSLTWAPVHDVHLDSGMFGSYTRHYGGAPEPGWVVQLIPPFRRLLSDLSDPTVELYD